MAEPSSTPAPTPAPTPNPNPTAAPTPSGLTPSAPPTVDHVEYQPISPWAITGFSLSLLFAVVILGSFLFAVYSGAPFYLPGWVVLLCLISAVISYVADRQV